MPQATTAKADATSASRAAAPGTTSEEAPELLSALKEAACILSSQFCVARDRENEKQKLTARRGGRRTRAATAGDLTDEGTDQASDGARDRVATDSAPDRGSRAVHSSAEDAATATTGTAAAAPARHRRRVGRSRSSLGLGVPGGDGLDGCARRGVPGRGDRVDGAGRPCRGGTISSASPFGGKLFSLARTALSVFESCDWKDPPSTKGSGALTEEDAAAPAHPPRVASGLVASASVPAAAS